MISKFKLESAKKVKSTKIHSMSVIDAYSGQLEIQLLSINDIELDPENHRDMTLTLNDAIHGIDKSDPEYDQKRRDWTSLESLANTIKENQLINPIYVYRFGNKCRLVAGERRTLASAIAGKKEIIARIADRKPEGVNLKALQWIENNERADLSLSEKIKSLSSILYENNKKDNPEDEGPLLIRITGMSKANVYKYLSIIKDESPLRDAIERGAVDNLRIAYEIASLKNKTEKQYLIEEAIKTKSIDKVSSLKRKLSSTNKKEKRGKKRVNISVGSVHMKAAEVFVESLLSNHKIDKVIKDKIKKSCSKLSWDDPESAQKGFKEVVKIITKSMEEI